MNILMERLQRAYCFARDGKNRDRGASMVEYAILVAVIAGVVLAATLFLGDQISTLVAGINLTT